jgi:DNA-binding transcriptional ArsR family regulator
MRLSEIRQEHISFRFSPVRETLRSIEVLLQPAHHAEQMPWIRAARRRLQRTLRDEFRHFRFLFVPSPELFPTLWEAGPAGAEEQIAILRKSPKAYAEAIVRRLSRTPLVQKSELDAMLHVRWYRRAAREHAARDPNARPMLEEFVASPARSLQRFCDMLAATNEEIVRPVWGAIESALCEDVEMRRRLLRAHGPTALLRTLSPELSIRHAGRGADIEFGPGQSHRRFEKNSRLELAPSFFCWPHVQAYVLDRPSGLRCSMTYPLPPLPARLTPLRDRRALAATTALLGDETRLRIIELLRARDLSTRELSGFLQLAAPQISRHLRTLLQGQIVERYRSGYFVMYRLNRQALKHAADAIGALV